jgi:hypothetical protein
MKKSVKLGLIVTACSIMVGCSTTNSLPYKASTNYVENQHYFSIQKNTLPDEALKLHVCRIKSFTRNIEAPDLFINGKKLFEIKNGSRFNTLIKKGDNFSIETTANPLLYRMKSEVIHSGIISDNSQFIIIKAEGNIGLGLSVLFGGAIGATLKEGTNSGPSGSWSFTVVDQELFEKTCK